MPDLEKQLLWLWPNINVAKEIGKYHQNKKTGRSNTLLQLAEKSTAVDIETNLLLLQAYAETQQFELVVKSQWVIRVISSATQFYFLFGIRIQSAQAI
jgi:hypothetical protein